MSRVGWLGIGLGGATVLLGSLVVFGWSTSWLSLRRGSLSWDHQAIVDQWAGGDREEARRRVQAWLERTPDDPLAWFASARLAVWEDRGQTALDHLARAEGLGLDRRLGESLKRIMLARSDRGREVEAMLATQVADGTALEPDATAALARLAIADFRLKQAQPLLDRWIRLAPGDPTPWVWRADILRRADAELDPILEAYTRALELDPACQKARLGLAEALLNAHRNDEAEAQFQTLLEQAADQFEIWLSFGRNAVEAGRFEEAATRFERALSLAPVDRRGEVHAEWGRMEARRGQLEAAREQLQSAWETSPYDADLAGSLGRVLRALGREAEARPLLERAELLRRDQRRLDELRARLVSHPEDVDASSEVARWMFDHGRDAEGLIWAERTLERAPDHAATHRCLATYYDRIGQPGLANHHRERAALKINQAHPKG